jgi:hypothetical protein
LSEIAILVASLPCPDSVSAFPGLPTRDVNELGRTFPGSLSFPAPEPNPVSALKPAQMVALANVALLAEECAHPRFGKRTPLGTVVVTVNAGYE